MLISGKIHSLIAISLVAVLSLSATCGARVIKPVSVVASSSSPDSINPAPGLYDSKMHESFVAARMNNGEPIIYQQLFAELGLDENEPEDPKKGWTEGSNINGPSLIRIPDWIAPEDRADPSAVYYMYFAHHRGVYIRMAWATTLEGPWHLYNSEPEKALPNRGVLGLGKKIEVRGRPRLAIELDNDLRVLGHIASPDVIVDHKNKEILMYFHAPTTHRGEPSGGKTLIARSLNGHGLDFNGGVQPVLLGEQYMRVFEWNDALYGSTGNRFWKSPNGLDEWPWTCPEGFDYSGDLWDHDDGKKFKGHAVLELANNPIYGEYNKNLKNDPKFKTKTDLSVRHTDVFVVENRVHVFYSVKAGAPERIIYSTIELNPELDEFSLVDAWNEVLTPELPWEGSEFDIEMSKGGRKGGHVRQLRDPDVFVDTDGRMYLAYSGQGEDAIGLASLTMEETITDFGKGWTAVGLQSSPLFVVLDLGASYDIDEITLYPQGKRDYQYVVQLSDSPDGEFSTIVDRSDNKTRAKSISDSVGGGAGRYIRLEVLGAHSYNGDFASIRELVIKGKKRVVSSN